MDLVKAMRISAAGMKVQGTRLRVISENLANRDSLALGPNQDPYARKVITFKNHLDRTLGVDLIEVHKITESREGFQRVWDPQHPAADADGYVQSPNVNSFIELMDMREAQRSYNANLNVIETSRGMIQKTLDILR
ncbi:MAG: flagellar basal body rod protein FlgC [Acetobacterales bacterium]